MNKSISIKILLCLFTITSFAQNEKILFKNSDDKGDYITGKISFFNLNKNKSVILFRDVFIDYSESWILNSDTIVTVIFNKLYFYRCSSNSFSDSLSIADIKKYDPMGVGIDNMKRNLFFILKSRATQKYGLYKFSIKNKTLQFLNKLDLSSDLTEAPFIKMKFLDSTHLFIENTCFDFFVYNTKTKALKKFKTSTESPDIRFCFSRFTQNGILVLRYKEGFTYDIQYISNDLTKKKLLPQSKFRFKNPSLVNIYSSSSSSSFVVEEAKTCYLYRNEKIQQLKLNNYKKILGLEGNNLLYETISEEIKVFDISR